MQLLVWILVARGWAPHSPHPKPHLLSWFTANNSLLFPNPKCWLTAFPIPRVAWCYQMQHIVGAPTPVLGSRVAVSCGSGSLGAPCCRRQGSLKMNLVGGSHMFMRSCYQCNSCVPGFYTGSINNAASKKNILTTTTNPLIRCLVLIIHISCLPFLSVLCSFSVYLAFFPHKNKKISPYLIW